MEATIMTPSCYRNKNRACGQSCTAYDSTLSTNCWIVEGFKLLVNNGLSVIEYVSILKARLN